MHGEIDMKERRESHILEIFQVLLYVLEYGARNVNNLHCNSSPISNMTSDLEAEQWFAANCSRRQPKSLINLFKSKRNMEV